MEIAKRTVTTITETEDAAGGASGEQRTEVWLQARLGAGEVYELELQDGHPYLHEGMRMLAFTRRNRYLDSFQERPQTFRIPEPALRGLLALLDGKQQHASDANDAAGDDADSSACDDDDALYDEE